MASRIILDKDEADFTFGEALKSIAKMLREFDESKHPRDPGGQWTSGGGGSDVGEAPPPSVEIDGLDDIRPGRPMPSQSGIVLVATTVMGTKAVEVMVNPASRDVKAMAREHDSVRVLRDLSDNIFVWDANTALHFEMQGALEAVEKEYSNWDSDEWGISKGKLVPVNRLDEEKGSQFVDRWIALGQANAKEAGPKKKSWRTLSERWAREKDFDESKHPRDDHGRWAGGAGGDGAAEKEPKEITQQEHTWLVSEHPPQETIDKWTKELTARSEALAAQGKAGNDEDSQIGRMQTALNSYQQESEANLKANLAAMSVVYDIEDRHLRGSAFTYRDFETNVATIQHFGALDHAAGVKALEIAVRQMEGSTARIEGKVFGDDKATQEMFKAAGFTASRTTDTYTKFVKENPGAKLFSKEHENEMLITSMATAQLLGYDPNMVVTNMGEMSFSVGSKGGYKAAGLAYLDSGKIEIFPRQIPNSNSAVSITAHEVAHQKFETVLNAVTAERAKVMADPETLAGMKADGTLKPPLDAKYPLYSRFAPFDNLTAEFIKDDGITNYSKDYWNAAKPDSVPQVTIKSAMHETIAEMARRQSETGRLEEASPLWRQFYRAVMETYDEIKKKPA